MSKNILFLFSAAILALPSCGGGWSDEQKEQLKNRCIGDGSYDCDCYVDKITKAHQNSDTYNALSKTEKDKLVESCIVMVEEIEEELESF